MFVAFDATRGGGLSENVFLGNRSSDLRQSRAWISLRKNERQLVQHHRAGEQTAAQCTAKTKRVAARRDEGFDVSERSYQTKTPFTTSAVSGTVRT